MAYPQIVFGVLFVLPFVVRACLRPRTVRTYVLVELGTVLAVVLLLVLFPYAALR